MSMAFPNVPWKRLRRQPVKLEMPMPQQSRDLGYWGWTCPVICPS